MTPATILELLIEFAQAFGIVEGDVDAWLRTNHPELVNVPVTDKEASLNEVEDKKLQEKFPKDKR